MAGEDDSDSHPTVQFGVVLAGAEPFVFNSNVNAVYRGQVQLSNGGTVTAFIKDLDQRELANELLAAALARRLGLPVPLSILARADPDVLAATKVPLAGSGSHVVFASSAVAAAPILQVFRDAGDQGLEVIDRLASWAKLGELYAFDAWIANIDRHMGNLLFSGQDAVWLIDHGHSFTGPAWIPADLSPATAYPHRLAEWLTPRVSGGRRAELAGQADRVEATASGIDVDAVAALNSVSVMLGSDVNAIVAFLTARAGHIRKLSTTALGLLI